MHMSLERSRDVAAYNDGIVNILHLLPEDVRERVNRERVEGALAGLTERERTAIEMRFGLAGNEAATYESMGERLGMTSMGAMKLFKRSCRKVVDRMRKFD